MIAISDDFYYLVFGVAAITMSFSWLLFGRLTMARVEKEIQADGHVRPASWDGVGVRILWYAYVYSLPIGLLNPRNDPFVDVALIRRYGNGRDRLLAKIFMVSGHFFVIWVFPGSWVFDLP